NRTPPLALIVSVEVPLPVIAENAMSPSPGNTSTRSVVTSNAGKMFGGATNAGGGANAVAYVAIVCSATRQPATGHWFGSNDGASPSDGKFSPPLRQSVNRLRNTSRRTALSHSGKLPLPVA